MMTSLIYKYKKPLEDQIVGNNQLFSSDINKQGSKKFIITTYDNAYEIIKNTNNLYEDHTYNKKIKLHIDIDYNRVYETKLERNKTAKKIIEEVIEKVNEKLKYELCYIF